MQRQKSCDEYWTGPRGYIAKLEIPKLCIKHRLCKIWYHHNQLAMLSNSALAFSQLEYGTSVTSTLGLIHIFIREYNDTLSAVIGWGFLILFIIYNCQDK